MNPATVKILLAEDSPSDADLLQESLCQTGVGQFEFTWVERLDAAIARLREASFDVLLLDLSLPDSTGAETFRRARGSMPRLPIVVLTGVHDERLGLEALREGVQDFLVKGQADGRQMARAIRYAIERHRAEEELLQAKAELEQRVAERTVELSRANQFLRMVSECNQAMVHASDEGKLTREICRIINDVGGYRMAWVGFAEQNKAKTIRPVASAGFEEGYLDKIKLSWSNSKYGLGPTGTAIRTGTVCFGVDFLSDPKLAPWRQQALQCGFRSSIALPLMANSQAFGVLTIYSVQPAAFDKSQINLLSDLAGDLAFGITALRAQTDRDRAQKNLEQKTVQLRALTVELVRAEQNERRRLARVLHDQQQQLLVAARYKLESLRVESQPKAKQQKARNLDAMLAQCLDCSRSLTAELSPPVLNEAGLTTALNWLGQWFLDTHGLTVRVLADDPLNEVNEEVQTTLFQAVRELLFNVVKHARVKHARVRISHLEDGQAKIVVSDRGAGFDPAELLLRKVSVGGLGLLSLKERLDLLGGQLEIKSAPGRGSQFTITAPLRGNLPDIRWGGTTGVSGFPAKAGPHSRSSIRTIRR